MFALQHDVAASSFYSQPPNREDGLLTSVREPILLNDAASEIKQEGATKCDTNSAVKARGDNGVTSLQIADGTIRQLKKELCDLQKYLSRVQPHIDRGCLKTVEGMFVNLLRAVKKSASQNCLSTLSLMPDLLSILDSSRMPFESWELERRDLQQTFSGARFLSSIDTGEMLRIDAYPLESQSALVRELEKANSPADLKYVSYATNDPRWLRVASFWRRCPLSLRWTCLSFNGDTRWLAYSELYSNAPPDLRWVSVLFQDPQWLHLGFRWKYTPTAVKLRAIQCQDIDIARYHEGDSLDGCVGGVCPRNGLLSGGGGFEARRFGMNDYYLLPIDLRQNAGLVTSLANRCVCCPIHCLIDGQSVDRLDLLEFKSIRNNMLDILTELRAAGPQESRDRAAKSGETTSIDIMKKELKILTSERERLTAELQSSIQARAKLEKSLREEIDMLHLKINQQENSNGQQLNEVKAVNESYKAEIRLLKEKLAQEPADAHIQPVMKVFEPCNHQTTIDQQRAIIQVLQNELEFLRANRQIAMDSSSAKVAGQSISSESVNRKSPLEEKPEKRQIGVEVKRSIVEKSVLSVKEVSQVDGPSPTRKQETPPAKKNPAASPKKEHQSSAPAKATPPPTSPVAKELASKGPAAKPAPKPPLKAPTEAKPAPQPSPATKAGDTKAKPSPPPPTKAKTPLTPTREAESPLKPKSASPSTPTKSPDPTAQIKKQPEKSSPMTKPAPSTAPKSILKTPAKDVSAEAARHQISFALGKRATVDDLETVTAMASAPLMSDILRQAAGNSKGVLKKALAKYAAADVE